MNTAAWLAGYDSYTNDGINPFDPIDDEGRYDEFEDGFCEARDNYESTYE